MFTTNDTASSITAAPLESAPPVAVDSVSERALKRTIARDISITVVVLASLIGGAWALQAVSTGTLKDVSGLVAIFFPIVIVEIAIFAWLERFAPAGPRKSLREWTLNTNITMAYLVMGPVSGVLGGYFTAALGRQFGLGWIDLQFATGKGTLALIAAGALGPFLGDFFYYWLHRLQHKIPVLWQEHKLHHLDPSLNVITDLRHHWLEGFIHIPLITVPLALFFKLDPMTAGSIGGIVQVLLLFWTTFCHVNIRLGFGRGHVLLTSPQLHRVHHSRLPEHKDRNFAAIFPIWDVIFGTYYGPARKEYPPSGVEGEKDVGSVTEALVLPFREWRRMFRQRRQTASAA